MDEIEQALTALRSFLQSVRMRSLWPDRWGSSPLFGWWTRQIPRSDPVQ